MASESQQPESNDGLPPTLDVAIRYLSGAKETCRVAPAQVALGSACGLLTRIKVRSSYSLTTSFLFTLIHLFRTP